MLRHAAELGPSRGEHRRGGSVAVVVPTLDEAATIAPICRSLVELREAGACSRVLVVDESSDDTAALARANGAEVIRQSSLRPDVGPVLGKGDAMWRALHAIEEDVVVFVDGDTSAFDPAVVEAIAAPVLAGAADFVKAAYRRPWDDGAVRHPTGGGRVTELAAKPLLRQLFPELATFGQPLAGEIAARTSLLRRLSFVTGYGVDVGLLIDVWNAADIDRVTEVETGPRQNRHRPLHQLAGTADDVVRTILSRAGLAPTPPLIERPQISPEAVTGPETPFPNDAPRPLPVAAST